MKLPMLGRIVAFSLLLFLQMSCGEDRVVDQAKEPPYADLTRKDDLLENLALSYEERNLAEYGRLLDPGFTFFFSSQDTALGKTPVSWDLAWELAATDSLFGDPFAPIAVPPGEKSEPAGCDSIFLAAAEKLSWGELKYYYWKYTFDPTDRISIDLAYVPGDSGWIASVPPDTSFTGETWYRKAASYEISVRTVDGDRYIAGDRKSAFYIRHVPSGNGSIWKIIQWYDDVTK